MPGGLMVIICPSSITYMTLHDPGFVGGEEPWDNSSLDFERRFRLGSEVTSLSLSRSSSSEKNDPLDNLNLNFRLTSSMRWDTWECLQKTTTEVNNSHTAAFEPLSLSGKKSCVGLLSVPCLWAGSGIQNNMILNTVLFHSVYFVFSDAASKPPKLPQSLPSLFSAA